MDKSLQALCNALKKLIGQLKPHQHALSFIVLTGRMNQGKTTLLRQSGLEHLPIDSERSTDVYYNQSGIIVELGEAWLNQNKSLLQHTLKALNRCHRAVKISGMILCVDINELLNTEPLAFAKTHAQLLNRFGSSLHYRLDTALVFTKLDAIAGFCEFFQNEHATELKKPLGFSLDWSAQQGKTTSNYKTQFEHFIETLGQQVIQKMHPARSTIKRTLIREFPLQLANLGRCIQLLLKEIPSLPFRLQSIYFTSGEQGGISIDRLNKKIQQEYALIVQDQFPQSINHRAYFIDGAIFAVQNQTKRQVLPHMPPKHRRIAAAVTSVAALALVWLATHHFRSAKLLDNTSKELLAYDQLLNKNEGADALYHLAQASANLNQARTEGLYLPTVNQLQAQLKNNTSAQLHSSFLPGVLAELEQTIIDTRQTQSTRYEALKIYLMLGDSRHFSASIIQNWFAQQWQSHLSPQQAKNNIALLKQTLKQPFQSITINQQIVSDIRNYLNALPVNYLYYSLAKPYFPQEKENIAVDGFELANKELPVYYTKAGFQMVLQNLPSISNQLKTDNWVLARQDLQNLDASLRQAYCYDYVLWWQNFMRHSAPLHIQDYQQARHLAEALQQSHAIDKLLALMQKETSPDLDKSSVFNQEVASRFTELSLVSRSAINDLDQNIIELKKFVSTLAVVNDGGKTAFHLAKSRFQGDTLFNPLSALYGHANQLPEPLSTWAKRIADDTWFILINECRNYINRQWQETVIASYQATIAGRFPFDATQNQEVSINDFEHFFAYHGVLNTFIEAYLKPFMDTSQAQWQLKELNNYVLPISNEMVNQLIRANVISNMFFPNQSDTSKIEFSLQKLSLDPVVSELELTIGNSKLSDTQNSESFKQFRWPEYNAKLSLNSIEGNHYELDEAGPWAFFKMLQKVNVLVDEEDSANLQILFEVNGNSGRYLLKTQNQVNPFIPGILNGFALSESIA